MAAILAPDEEEAYLLAILDGPDGIDLAEFSWTDEEQEDGCFRAWDFQWCVGGETVIYTDRGRRRISDAVGDTRLVTSAGPERGEWVDAEIRSFGRAWLWRLVLERRHIRRELFVTADHRHFAGAGRADRRVYQDKRTCEMQVGDFLKPATSPRQPFGLDREAVQAGIVFGDGTAVGSRSLVRLYGGKIALARWFDVPATDYPHHSAAVSAVQVRNLPGECKTVMPDVAAKSEQLWGWLAGYFATDGSVLPDGTAVLTSVNQAAMFRVRDLATALGVVVSAVGHRTVTTQPPGAPAPHEAVECRVVLRVSDLPEEFFLLPAHAERVASLRSGQRSRAIDAWKVVAIEPNVRYDEIYCAVVPETHSFVLDGDILTGNSWYTCEDPLQIDQCARSLGKSNGVQMRAFAFPFNHPGAEMLITAPELNHLRPLTDAVEARIMASRMASEMLPRTRGRGLSRQPHWQARFANGARIMSRLPNKDGKGVKGQHPLVLESDEMQDYPLAGWIELIETLKRGSKGAQWRAHGVSRGVHDKFFEFTQDDSDFTVHRYMAMHRPTWSKEERDEKEKTYKSRMNSDYKRNIYGDHGDATNPVFVLARLMACVDTDEASEYNTDIYQRITIDEERLRGTSVSAFLDVPGTHLTGHSLAPKGYTAYYGGADIGLTNHPSEFLIFGVRASTGVHELLLRVHMERVDTDGHMELLDRLFTFYGPKLKGFGLDRTGLGFPISQMASKAWYSDRFHGYNFSENVAVGFREPKDEEDPNDLEALAEMRNVVEHSTDVLRNKWVDPRKAWLPFDRELLSEWQGQNYCQSVDTEILTDRGWLHHSQVEAGDRTLGVTPEGTSVWTPIESVHVFPAIPREMVRMEGAHLSSYGTADHRWLARRHGKAAPLEFVQSQDFVPDVRVGRGGRETANRWRIPITALRTDNPTQAKYDDDFVELVAWFWTEGSWTPSGALSIGQSETVNPEHVARIEALLRRLLGAGERDLGRRQTGTRWSVTSGRAPHHCAQYRVLDAELKSLMASVVSRSQVSSDNKVVSPEFLTSLTGSQLRLFIDVSLLGDGCEFTRSRVGRLDCQVRVFTQKGAARTAVFEMACALAGIATRTIRRADADLYVVTLSDQQYTHTMSTRREVVTDAVEVWCPSTGTGTWLARRNGRVYFTGNTIVKSAGSPYGKRDYARGKFHSLDAGKMAAAAETLPPIAEMIDASKASNAPAALDIFVGAM